VVRNTSVTGSDVRYSDPTTLAIYLDCPALGQYIKSTVVCLLPIRDLDAKAEMLRSHSNSIESVLPQHSPLLPRARDSKEWMSNARIDNESLVIRRQGIVSSSPHRMNMVNSASIIMVVAVHPRTRIRLHHHKDDNWKNKQHSLFL